MEKNIKVHIKDRVAVAEGDPVIVCGNSDYSVTFTFDEEWGEAYAKTARFKFQTKEGPEHIDQPFTGDTVEVPELSGIREVEVGVFVGDLNTTTGAPIRCRPCIRCGSGAPKDPEPDVYDKIMKLIKQGGGGSGGGGTLDGLPVYVVDALPDDPEVGDIAALNTHEVLPWDKVKVYGRDEVPKDPDTRESLFSDLSVMGNFITGEAPGSFDLSSVAPEGYWLSGVYLVGSTGYIQVNAHNLSNQLDPSVQIQVSEDFIYMCNSKGWQASDGGSPVNVSVQDVIIPKLFDAVAIDYTALLTDKELQDFESMGTVTLAPAVHVLQMLGVFERKPGLYIAEAKNESVVWQMQDQQVVKQLTDLTSQLAKLVQKTNGMETDMHSAVTTAFEAREASAKALGDALNAQNTANAAQTTADDALNAAIRSQNATAEAQVTASQAKSQAETNAGTIAELQEAVNGYSTFLEEINGEVVEDE